MTAVVSVQTPDGTPLARAEREQSAVEGWSAGGTIDTLYRRHAARLRHFFARRGAREDADDLVQETFAKLTATQRGLERVERPEAYVTTVAVNVLRDRARSAARRALLLDRADGAGGEVDDDPYRLLENRQSLRAIEAALSTMNPRRRRIFLLHRLEQLTYAEIGQVVGMSEKGVKKQMAKALVELRQAMDRAA